MKGQVRTEGTAIPSHPRNPARRYKWTGGWADGVMGGDRPNSLLLWNHLTHLGTEAWADLQQAVCKYIADGGASARR